MKENHTFININYIIPNRITKLFIFKNLLNFSTGILLIFSINNKQIKKLIYH
jgi:hypothetical protein